MTGKITGFFIGKSQGDISTGNITGNITGKIHRKITGKYLRKHQMTNRRETSQKYDMENHRKM